MAFGAKTSAGKRKYMAKSRDKNLNGVKSGRNFAKWGKRGEFPLNGVIVVTNVKLWGKIWNLL